MMDDTGGNGGGFGQRTRRAMPVLACLAAMLVSIAAVVFVVDTLRDDDGAANEATTAAAAAGESAQAAPDGDGGLLEELLGGDGLGDLIALVLRLLPGIFGGGEGDGDFGRFFGGDGGRFFGGDGGRFPAIPREWAPPAEAQGALIGVSVEEAEGGVRVVSVTPGLGADAAGVEPGDLLLAADGEPIESVQQLRDLVGKAEAGDELTLRISRDGSERELTVTLSPGAAAESWFGFRFGEDGLDPEDLDLSALLEALGAAEALGGAEGLADLMEALDGAGDSGDLMKALPEGLREQLEELLGEGALPQPQEDAAESSVA